MDATMAIDDEDGESEDDRTPAREKSDALLIKEKNASRNSEAKALKDKVDYATKKVTDGVANIFGNNGTDEAEEDELDFIKSWNIILDMKMDVEDSDNAAIKAMR